MDLIDALDASRNFATTGCEAVVADVEDADSLKARECGRRASRLEVYHSTIYFTMIAKSLAIAGLAMSFKSRLSDFRS